MFEKPIFLNKKKKKVITEKPINSSTEEKEKLEEDFWFKTIEKLLKEHNKEVPDPIEIKARAIVEALGIPSGQSSSIELNADNKNKDKIIAEYLTNIPGVLINKEKNYISHDFRDIYPNGLPEKLKEVLDPRTLKIIETEYQHRDWIREQKMNNSKNNDKLDVSVNYFRLPNGIDLFLRGYYHIFTWQKTHSSFFKEANKYAELIALEGASVTPFGESLETFWKKHEFDTYDDLMREAVDGGFDGYFSEVDARDKSKINMDNGGFILPKIKDTFFRKYFEYLKKENPSLINSIKSPTELKKVFEEHRLNNSSEEQLIQDKTRFIKFEPTSVMMGQKLFTDALAAIKLLLIGKLMSDGHIKKGPIIDYEGSAHVNSKTFFLNNPQYALEIVLRTMSELMAGTIKKKNDFNKVSDILDNPDWTEVVRQITKLSFKKVINDPQKTIKTGKNQREIKDVSVDFLDIYGINPNTVIPSEAEIRRIQKMLEKKIINN